MGKHLRRRASAPTLGSLGSGVGFSCALEGRATGAPRVRLRGHGCSQRILSPGCRELARSFAVAHVLSRRARAGLGAHGAPPCSEIRCQMGTVRCNGLDTGRRVGDGRRPAPRRNVSLAQDRRRNSRARTFDSDSSTPIAGADFSAQSNSRRASVESSRFRMHPKFFRLCARSTRASRVMKAEANRACLALGPENVRPNSCSAREGVLDVAPAASGGVRDVASRIAREKHSRHAIPSTSPCDCTRACRACDETRLAS